MGRGRSYRVPRRVVEAVRAGVVSYTAGGGGGAGDEEALRMARVLTSDSPVEVDVPTAVGVFFSDGWEFDPAKVRVSGLYGGEIGRSWALKCVVAAGLVAAADVVVDGNVAGSDLSEPFRGWMDDPEEFMELYSLSGEDLWDIAGVDGDVVGGGGSQGTGSVVEPGDGGVLSGSDVLTAGDVGAGVVVVDGPVDGGGVLGVDVMRDTIAAASAELAADGGGAVGSEVVVPGVDTVPPVGGGGDHHAERQLRDYHGRFAKPGARVQGRGGNLGWVKGGDGKGSAVVTLDDGSEVTVDPKEMKVVTAEGRARLAPAPAVIEDPLGRLEAYQEWAAEQLMGGGV